MNHMLSPQRFFEFNQSGLKPQFEEGLKTQIQRYVCVHVFRLTRSLKTEKKEEHLVVGLRKGHL